jgi:hypothetical protein
LGTALHRPVLACRVAPPDAVADWLGELAGLLAGWPAEVGAGVLPQAATRAVAATAVKPVRPAQAVRVVMGRLRFPAMGSVLAPLMAVISH